MDARDDNGNTPLWRATFASMGFGGVIEQLLAADADPNLANNHGVTPLGLAQTIANYDVKQFFESRPNNALEGAREP